MIKTKQSGIKTATQSNFLNYVTNSEVASSLRQRAENEGGFFGGVGYLFEKLAVGFMSSVEGIWDYAAGGIADLFGADKWAESQMENDWFGDWYSHPEEWYNPSSGWQTAGDVAGGIGTSAPSMLAVAGAGAIAYFSGGSLSPVAAGLISAAVAGLGAAGNATKEAYKETGKLGAEEYGYGAMVGVTEGAVEGLTSVIGAGSGKIVKSIANSFGKQAAKSVGKTTAKSVVLDLGKAFISEAFEEGFATWIDPYYKRATYDPNAENATAQEITYSAVVGGIAGMIMDGVAKVTNTGISYLKGRNIANKGNAKEVMKLSEYLSAFENQNKTEDETYTYIAETYAKLAKSLASTGGEIKTAGQKKLLGDLQRANTVAVFKPMVYKSAANIVSNAEIVAERINSYYKDANGNPLNVTAADIVKGIDKSSPQAMSKSFQKALQENGILRTLAVADTTGHLFLDAERFEQRMMQSNIASQADLNRFIETASEEKKASLGEALGIENWDTIELEEFNEKFQAFVSNGDIETFKAKNALIEEFKSLQSKEPKRGIPKNIHSLKDGETRTFNDGYSHIAIKRAGDGFTIYDYGTGNISHELSLKDANKALRTYAFKRDETVAHNDKVDAERNKITEVNKYATENIKGYSALSDANKGEIRRLIRQGRAKGINDNDILMYARVATRTGVRISFDKEALAVAKDKDTQKFIYADGVYDGANNVIVVNPEATRTVEALLIHELTHAIDKTADGKIILMKGVENMSDEEKQAIVKRYTKAGHGGTIELKDEINAHYAEGQLANRKTLEKLLEKEPSLKDKILSFFKKASADTEDERLSKKANAFYKTYKKMFDKFADRNYQSNSIENAVTNIKQENMHVSEKKFAYEKAVVNNDILDMIKKIETGSFKDNEKVDLGVVSEHAAKEIKKLLNIDVTGYKIAIEARQIAHILKDHGKNGKTDQSMSNDEDIAKMAHVLENFNKITPAGKSSAYSYMKNGRNRTADTVLYEREIGEKSYYVVQAVPEAQAKTLFVVSAFIGEKGYERKIKNGTSQLIDAKSPNATPKAGSVVVPNDRIAQNEPNVNTNDKKSYAMPKTDQEYLVAVEKGDIETAQKMVDEAAKKAGYDSPLLFHGTQSFGFTEFDLSKMDDKRSIFLTSNPRIAATYSGVMGTREMSNQNSVEVDTMTAEEIVAELNSNKYKFGEEDADEYKYSYLDLKDINRKIKEVNEEIESLKGLVDEKIRSFADKMANGFEYDDYNAHEKLVYLKKKLDIWDYNELPTAIYGALHYSTAFKEEGIQIAELEKNLRLIKKLQRNDNSNGVIVEDWLEGYSLELLTLQDAKDRLTVRRKSGNYSLYANLGKSLEIDCNGSVWRDIRHWTTKIEVSRTNTYVERVGNEYILFDKESRTPIHNGDVAVNTFTENMDNDRRQMFLIDMANQSLRIIAEEYRTTREISEYAQSHGFDSVTFKNIKDNGGLNSFVKMDETADIYVLFDPENVKSADPVTYDNEGNIVPLSERFDASKKDMRFALPNKDIQGNELTAEQQEFFKDSKIRAVEREVGVEISPEGSLLPVYHGTNSGEFYEFDKKLTGSSNDAGWYGRGFYFAFNKGEAEYYGRRVIECYLNIKNPFFFSEEMQSYDGVESGDVFFDFGSFIINFAKKFPKLAAQESITITKEFDGQGNGDSFEKSIVDFAAELEELYKSERLKLNEVHSDEGKYYEYKFKNNVDEIVKDEELKKLIRENWIDTPYMANVAYKNGEITFEQSNAIMDLMDEYGYENFRDARIHGARFKTKESAEKNRLSACVSYLSNHRYAYIEQHMPEHYIQRISKQFTEELKAQGYDGIVQSKYGDEIVAFEENQIKLTSNKKPTVNKDMRFALPYTAPTTDAVTTEVEQAYKPTIKDKVFTGWTATQIAFTNAQAGIEKVGKILGVSDIESIVQAARSATNQADEMLAGNQRRIGDKSKVYQGEGLEKILRPVKEKGTEYTEVFFDYLFNYHNVNRMNFEAISIARNNGKVKLLAKNKKDITNLKKRKSALIKSRSTAKNASARKSIQTQIKDIDSQINAIEKVNKKLENDIASFVPAENKPVLDCTAKESATYIKEYEKNYPEFKGIARKLWNFIENLNQYRVDTGLISQDTMMYLKQIYPHYVPTYRTDTNQGIGAVVGKYNLEVKKAIKRAKGSTKDLLPIDVMLARQVEETIRAGRINVIANALYEGAQSSGKSTYIEVISKEKVSESEQANIDPMDLRPKNNQVTFFRDGEKITMRVSSEVFAGFDAFAPRVDISNPLLKIANKVNDTFKRLVTSLNPAFLLRNSARDIQDAGIYSKYPKSFLKNYARAAKYITEDHDLWQLYRSMGGLNSSVFDFDKGIVGAQNKWGLTKAEGNLLTKLLVNVENANAFVEQLPRFAEFISSIEAGNTTEQAILDSADVTTNFGRSGTLTKKLNSTLIPFLNPAIQGFSKLIRTITGARTAKEITALLLKIAVVGIIPHLINDLMYDDDEDYEQLRDTDKENNFLFKISDKFIKIPKGRVASIFAGLVNRTKDMFEGESDAWDGYVDNVIQQVTPVSNFSRTIFSPFMDVSNNLTWYGSAIEGQQFENTAPKDRYDESTSSIAVWLGQLLNYSPKKIHYILDQYSGVIGDFILPATTQKAEKDFISGNFTLDPVSSNKLSTDFYNIYEEAQYAKTAGDDTAIYQVKYLNKVKSAVSEMYKQKSEIQKSDLTDEEKLVQTNAIQILINEAFKTAVSDYESWTDTVQKTQGVGADLSSSERVTLRYTESLRIMYGSERALREYDAKVYENCQLLSKANISYDDLYYFYFFTRNITSDKDKQGNTIAGSKRNKIMSAVNQLKLPAEQKLILIASKGYALTEDEKNTVARYIVKLKKLSKDDKIALAEMCGLEVKGGKIVTKKPVKPLKLRLN